MSRRLPRLLAGLTVPCLLASLATAGTLYVDANLTTGANDGSSWTDAYQGASGLQAALAAAASGDRIFVAEGTYLPSSTGSRSDTFALSNGVEVFGSFLGGELDPGDRPPFGTAPSILSGDLNGDDGAGSIGDNSYHVVHGAGTTASAVLDGFYVRGGNAGGGGGTNTDRGGGILCVAGSSPTIRNCRFEGNRCTFGGGAGYINGSAPSFTDTTFVDNVGGSFGGAFDIATAGAVRFERCRFLGNRASRAGALEIFSTNGVVVTNSLFQGNTSTGTGGGGAIWTGSGGTTAFVCCTVTDNSTGNSQHAGLRNQGATVNVSNSIFWANTAPGGAQGSVNQVSAGVNVTYCLVQGGYAGTGNIGLDPRFADPGAGDYRLGPVSPAMDAGDNGTVPGGVIVDLGGEPRFVDEQAVDDTGAGTAPLVDMGAHESQGIGFGLYCYGDGSGTPCPCFFPGGPGEGCANSTFFGAVISVSGTNSLVADDLTITGTQLIAGQSALMFTGTSKINGGLGVPFGEGLRCIGGAITRFGVVQADGAGAASWGPGLGAGAGWAVGQTVHYQVWYRDPVGLCGGGFNLSPALTAVLAP